MLQSGPSTGDMAPGPTLPDLPSKDVADQLLETVYAYTQARYCIVDWVQMREWHRRRETTCYSSKKDDTDSQTGLLTLIQCIVGRLEANLSQGHILSG